MSRKRAAAPTLRTPEGRRRYVLARCGCVYPCGTSEQGIARAKADRIWEERILHQSHHCPACGRSTAFAGWLWLPEHLSLPGVSDVEALPWGGSPALRPRLMAVQPALRVAAGLKPLTKETAGA